MGVLNKEKNLQNCFLKPLWGFGGESLGRESCWEVKVKEGLFYDPFEVTAQRKIPCIRLRKDYFMIRLR